MFKHSLLSFTTAAFVAGLVTACGGDGSSSATTDSLDAEWRTYCLDKINEYRATENLKPLKMASDKRIRCTDNQAADDLSSGVAHGNFGDCGEFAQNSAPNISLSWLSTETEIIDYYLENMWAEKKLVESGERDPDNKADYPSIGHYLNMRNSNADSVACGMAKSSNGETAWMNINFY